MMITRRFASCGAAAVLAVGLGATGVRAEGTGPCLSAAQHGFIDCKKACVEDFQLAKDTCANRDHACVETCRSARQICRQPTVDVLNAALAVCASDLATAVGNCRNLFADGTPERDSCIDNAQVGAFQCRDRAYTAAAPGLRSCRKQFRSCVNMNCPPLSVPDPAAVTACKSDARGLLAVCVATCVENRQLAKDTCLNRDHVCVENCRAQRDTCRQPSVDSRAAAIAVCQQNRDQAIAGCPPPGDPGRAACIDQVQVLAFQCRDAAREAVQAALDGCRQAFQTCAQACPPPAGS